MRHTYFFIIFWAVLPLFSQAQTITEAPMGAGYTDQTFVDLSNGTATSISTDTWDLAFTVAGQQDAGISINEGASYGEAVVMLYLSAATDFSTTIDPSTLGTPISNDELSWDNGALNSVKDESNPLDFGWGAYNPASHVVEGSRIFVLQKRDGSYIKFMIESLSTQGVYTIKYADLDGGNEQTQTIAKSDYPNASLVFFSFSTNDVIATPDEWDMLFTRYETLVPNGEGGHSPYTVTGVLSGYGVEVAQADGVTASDMTSDNFYNTYSEELSSDLTVIGWDWKQFGGTSFVVVTDRVYFVKNANGDVYKVNFIGFEGSSTGLSVFEQEHLTNTVGIADLDNSMNTLGIFPNPVGRVANITFQSTLDDNAELTLFDITGQLLTTTNRNITAGENRIHLEMETFPKGQYLLQLETSERTISTIIQKR